MMFQQIDEHSGKWSLRLMVLALVALATSFFLKTPELQKKADKLEVVEKKEIPKLLDGYGCQTQRARVATQQLVKSENGQDANLKVIPNCPLPPKLAAEKKAEAAAQPLLTK